MRDLPQYYDYFGKPLKIVQTPDGGVRAYRLDIHTGRFEIANSTLWKIRLARSSDDIFGCDEEEFVKLAEERRASSLQGDGPIFALYKLISDAHAQWDMFDAPTKQAIGHAVRDFRHLTFQLWEQEFTRRDAGDPPTFHYEAIAGPAAVDRYSRPDPTPDLPQDDWR